MTVSGHGGSGSDGSTNGGSPPGLGPDHTGESFNPNQSQQSQQIQHQGQGQGWDRNVLQVPNPDASASGSSSGDDDGGLRPGFKRLPSQTLQQSYAKRHIYQWGGGGGEEIVDDTDSDADSHGYRRGQPPTHVTQVQSQFSSRSGSVASGDAGSTTSSLNGSPYMGTTGLTTGQTQAPPSHLRTQIGAGTYKVPELTQAMWDRYRRLSAPSGQRPDLSDVAVGALNSQSQSPAHVGVNVNGVKLEDVDITGSTSSGIVNGLQPQQSQQQQQGFIPVSAVDGHSLDATMVGSN